ncbi:hypothetical protein PIB30_093380 [Stylosanthes scabra]|uniref:Uncharacterized protein n=1 Tax=Stylosanthes scabra TaxID=79078 RepID=A0ABU6RVJ9_9FABA|nr:hypothetical protein [Stylosanthes scabra]
MSTCNNINNSSSVFPPSSTQKRVKRRWPWLCRCGGTAEAVLIVAPASSNATTTMSPEVRTSSSRVAAASTPAIEQQLHPHDGRGLEAKGRTKCQQLQVVLVVASFTGRSGGSGNRHGRGSSSSSIASLCPVSRHSPHSLVGQWR